MEHKSALLGELSKSSIRQMCCKNFGRTGSDKMSTKLRHHLCATPTWVVGRVGITFNTQPLEGGSQRICEPPQGPMTALMSTAAELPRRASRAPNYVDETAHSCLAKEILKGAEARTTASGSSAAIRWSMQPTSCDISHIGAASCV